MHGIWNSESHALDERIHFFLELPACLAVAAPLQSPMTEAVRAFRVRTAEHIQGFDVPKIHTLLHALAGLIIFRRQFRCLIGAKPDMPHLFFENLGQNTLQRQIAAIEKFFQKNSSS